LFSLVAERLGADYVALAAIVATVAALVLTLREATRNSFKILDVAGVATFAAIAAIAIVGTHHTDIFLADYGRGISTYILAAIMAISALTIPFTEQYARETVDPRYWASPIFRAKNRSISLMWAGVIFVIATCHIIAGALASASVIPGAHPGNIILNWLIPIVLIIATIKRTRAMADAPATTPAPTAYAPTTRR
jgi:hypothetical protein